MQNDANETRPFWVLYLQKQPRKKKRNRKEKKETEKKQRNLVTQILVMPLPVTP